jgi:phosphogluconate dehydratase
MTINPILAGVTDRIVARSKATRQAYLGRIRAAMEPRPRRSEMACSNLAHGMAACAAGEKAQIRGNQGACIAIVSAYNDMLSAHQPFESFPALIKQEVAAAGGVARFAGGVPAMCDGVTQGMAGMELSLFSRDVIDGRRPVPRSVRWRAAAGRLRQDRPRFGDRRADLRSSADDLRPGRPDADRHRQ